MSRYTMRDPAFLLRSRNTSGNDFTACQASSGAPARVWVWAWGCTSAVKLSNSTMGKLAWKVNLEQAQSSGSGCHWRSNTFPYAHKVLPCHFVSFLVTTSCFSLEKNNKRMKRRLNGYGRSREAAC